METATKNSVVVRFKDGSVLKGTTSDFFPNKTQFHLTGLDEQTNVVEVSHAKAIFFVKDFAGDKSRQDAYDLAMAGAGRKMRVQFLDNEVIVGHTLGYSPDRQGFFMVPADPGSNNERIFVVKAATKNIQFL